MNRGRRESLFHVPSSHSEHGLPCKMRCSIGRSRIRTCLLRAMWRDAEQLRGELVAEAASRLVTTLNHRTLHLHSNDRNCDAHPGDCTTKSVQQQSLAKPGPDLVEQQDSSQRTQN
jgi:hypothetical protein